jgi:hypothetical protein
MNVVIIGCELLVVIFGFFFLKDEKLPRLAVVPAS